MTTNEASPTEMRGSGSPLAMDNQDAVIAWLIDSDPSIRWQVMRDAGVGATHLEIDQGEGKPSRWNTLRAMRVLEAFAS